MFHCPKCSEPGTAREFVEITFRKEKLLVPICPEHAKVFEALSRATAYSRALD